MALVLDAGALLAIERGDRSVAALVRSAEDAGEVLLVSSGCVAQAWRAGGPRKALLAWLLRGAKECELGPNQSREIGKLCAQSGTSDVVDAHVALLTKDGDVVLTSDPNDLRMLMKITKTKALVASC